MSRFIKYASNLLDGVDSMAKDSLTDQDIAAAAAERRRKRKQQVKLRASNMMNEGGTGAGVGGVGGGGVAEPSEGELSGNNSSYNNARGASAAEAGYDRGTRPQQQRGYSYEQQAGASSLYGEGGGSAAEEDGGDSRRGSFAGALAEGGGGGGGGGGGRRGGGLEDTERVPQPSVSSPAGRTAPTGGTTRDHQPIAAITAAATAAVAAEATGVAVAEPAAAAAGVIAAAATPSPQQQRSPAPLSALKRTRATPGFSPSSGDETAVTTPAAAVAIASTTPQRSEAHRRLREISGGTGGAPGKEDGSVWSDRDTVSSAATSPLGHGRGGGNAGTASGGVVSYDDAGEARQQRPPPLGAGLVVDISSTHGHRDGDNENDNDKGSGNDNGNDDKGLEVGVGVEVEVEVGQGRARASTATDSRASIASGLPSNHSLSPSRMAPSGPPQPQRPQDCGASARGGEVATAATAAPAALTSTVATGARSGDTAVAFLGSERTQGAATGTSAARPGVGLVSGDGRPQIANAPVSGGSAGGGGGGGRERRGRGGLLRMGGGGGGGDVGGGSGDAKGLRAEAMSLRAEVEELSLELEEAEDSLRGQEAELKMAAEKLRRQKAAAAEREKTMAAEMDELRSLQLQEKKVFLTNLEGMERALKEKERETDEARSALSALEAFAMEREDTAARLTHEKEELLEELKGARSGQNRSAEEVREALTRAEAEAESVEARHRAWMRQAQARQTDLEATAAQLAAALAEAKRGSSSEAAEGAQHAGPPSVRTGRAQASDRELRALRDELDSCQASLELEQERTRSLQQEANALRYDLDAARATEAVVERQRQEHATLAADSFAKVSHLEQQLQDEKASTKRLRTSAPTSGDQESQIQSLSSKLLDKQARLEESVCERATLSVKLQEASARAFRAEQELREARGDSLEGGVGGVAGVGGMRSRRRQDRAGGSRASPTGSWSRLAPIAKHEKIASAVDVLDRQTLQAVVFLRNSSVARASFLGYLLLLHLWAFAVLSFHSSSITPNMEHPVDQQLAAAEKAAQAAS